MKNIYFLLYIFLLINGVKGFIYSENNRLYDEYKLERIFHGVNVVYKGYPWHPNIDRFNPETSFSIEDIEFLKQSGFNAIRLGVMWPGLEPYINQINTTYLDVLEKIVNMCKENDIYVILDFHQDVLSNKFCGEGIPDWAVFTDNITHPFPYPIDKPYTLNKGIPLKNDCNKHNWITYQFTQQANKAYQDLYDNYNNIKDKFIDFWRIIANRFKNHKNCIGYELINEPWAGDVFKYPELLVPKIADKKNLEPFYNDIVQGIVNIDSSHSILFESVTWDIYGVGFEYSPGNRNNKSILSYHAYFPPNIFIETSFKVRKKDMERLDVGGFLTEFSYGSGNTGDVKDLEKAKEMVEMADKYLQSWTIWEYKSFFPITGPNKGFFNKDGSLTNTYYTLSRPYAMYVEGNIVKMGFNNKTKSFNLVFKPNYTINRNSKIYINNRLHFPNGYNINILPKLAIKYVKKDNYLYLYLNKTIKTEIVNILIKPIESHILT
uniref:Glycoside hydrolase family 5 domain-containing protein n=1 Tax=viral metagenome TaxID=1070528 RepID=A0A6C0JCS3_9ZZZZ